MGLPPIHPGGGGLVAREARTAAHPYQGPSPRPPSPSVTRMPSGVGDVLRSHVTGSDSQPLRVVKLPTVLCPVALTRNAVAILQVQTRVAYPGESSVRQIQSERSEPRPLHPLESSPRAEPNGATPTCSKRRAAWLRMQFDPVAVQTVASGSSALASSGGGSRRDRGTGTLRSRIVHAFRRARPFWRRNRDRRSHRAASQLDRAARLFPLRRKGGRRRRPQARAPIQASSFMSLA